MKNGKVCKTAKNLFRNMHTSNWDKIFGVCFIVYIVADSFGVCCASIPAVGHYRAGHSKAFGGVKWQDQ
jgi:hypothetical protein